MHTGYLVPKQPLGLSVEKESISVTHHSLVEQKSANRWGFDNPVVTSTLTLAELQKDSDNDGLTDICEECLMTDPHLMDTDGDGLEDSEDPHPQVNASKMDRLERGLSRALSFFYASSMNLGGSAPTTPYQSVRLYLEPPLEVAWTMGSYTYGIVETVEPSADSVVPHLQVFSKQEILDYDPCDTEVHDWQRGNLMFSRYAFAYVSEERIESVVYYYVGLGAYLIVLVDVEGELYPATQILAWIS
jgi:hypothetical protein